MVSWGGNYQDAQREIFFEPFTAETGTPLIEDVEPQFSALPSESLPRPSTPLQFRR